MDWTGLITFRTGIHLIWTGLDWTDHVQDRDSSDMDWTHHVQDRDPWRALVLTAI
jgi:hypothetical protein